MKISPLSKNFFREIKNTFPRFLSILLIVFLGTAFFSGIRAAEPDLRYSYTDYFKSNNLFDIRAVSTLGLTQDDVDAIKKIDGVEKAEAGYYTDLISHTKKEKHALRVMEISDELNTLKISDGEMPKAKDECLIDNNYAKRNEIKVGEKIQIKTDDGEKSENLFTDEFKVVGLTSSPEYPTHSRGNTTVGNGQLSGFMMVAKDAFTMDVYTKVDVKVKGAQEQVVFTDGYEKLVNPVLDRIKDIADERCEIRKNDLRQDGQSEIDKGREELESAKKDTQVQLAKAKDELESAKKKSSDGLAEIAKGKQSLITGQNEINEKSAQLNEATKLIDEGRKQLESGEKEYEEQLSQWQQGKNVLDAASQQISQKENELAQLEKEYAKGKEGLSQLQTALAGVEAAIQEYIQRGLPVPPELIAQRDQLKSQIQTLEQTLNGMKTIIDTGRTEIKKAKEELESKRVTIQQAKQMLDFSKTQIDESKNELREKEAELLQGQALIAQGRKQLDESKIQLENAEKEILNAKPQIESGEKELLEKTQQANDEFEKAGIKLDEASEKLRKLEDATWIVKDRNLIPGYTECGENADRIKSIGKVFPVIFFLVAALISLTTMTRMVEEERTQIGTLKSLGYSRFSIARKYILYALLATFIGSVLGVLVGEKVIPYVVINAYSMAYPNMKTVSIPYDLGQGAIATLVAVACTVTATFIACVNELKSAPSELMRPPAPKSGKRIFLERISFLWKRLSFSQKSTFRNLARYKRRLFMTVIGIGGCMALIIVGFGLRGSIADIVRLQFQEIQKYDAMAMIDSKASEEEKNIIISDLQQNDQVKGMSPILYKTAETFGQKSSEAQKADLVVPQTKEGLDGFVDLRDRVSSKKYKMEDSGVIITEKLAKLNDLSVGDNIEISLDSKRVSVKIEAITENYLSHYIYMTPNLYESLYGEKASINAIDFTVKDPAKSSEVGEKILQNKKALSVIYISGFQEQLDNMLSSLDIVIIVLIVSAGLLAFIVLYNLNNINIGERIRELASIKVLGFKDLEVAAYVYRENIYLTLMGIGLGLILGKLLHGFIITTVEVNSCMFSRTLSIESFLAGAILTALFSALVNWVMYFKLKKIDMAASLKSVE